MIIDVKSRYCIEEVGLWNHNNKVKVVGCFFVDKCSHSCVQQHKPTHGRMKDFYLGRGAPVNG